MHRDKENIPKAVILLSGGLDSSTVLAIAIDGGYECHCLSFSYGQRQTIEIEKARENAKLMGCREHLVLRLDLDRIGGSALTDDVEVPKNRSDREITSSIPVTYVPFRNTIFLSHAVAWAEVLGAEDIFIGINQVDYSGYPDCRPQYLKAFEEVAFQGSRFGAEGGGRFRIHAPLLHMTKTEIIKKGIELGVDYSLTHSCYDPEEDGQPCGLCDACKLRRRGFSGAGLEDPVLKKTEMTSP